MSTKLAPADPPGRCSRKARGYSTEIRQLRAQGYTFEAIRIALAEVGIEVSNRTVQREAAKTPERGAGATDTRDHPIANSHAPGPARIRTVTKSAHELQEQPTTCAPACLSGKEVAEAFRRSQCDNPLIRAKEQS